MAGNKKQISIPKDSSVTGAVEVQDFKQSFVDTLQESNSAREQMKIVLHELLRQPDTVEEITNIVNKVDRDAVKSFWGKFGFLVWSAFVFVVGAIATAIIGKIIK